MPTSKTNFPVLSIVGTTAVGKTDLAFEVAHALLLENDVDGVDIISADSKQVFQDLEQLTGADIPSEFSRVHDTTISDRDFFEHQHIRLFGISMLEPTEEWSVSQFQQYAHSILKNSFALQHSVIIVGGTGLFHKHLFNDDPRLHISPNEEIRKKATTLSVEELQDWLKKIDADYFAQMNESDQHNPRRLVRAIEIAEADTTAVSIPALPFHPQHFYLGISLPVETLMEKIAQRVEYRLSQAQGEVVAVSKDHHISNMVQAILGFEQLSQLEAGTLSEAQCLADWTLTEQQYAKRQLTWWKAIPQIEWFDVKDNEQRKGAVNHAVNVLRHGVRLITDSK